MKQVLVLEKDEKSFLEEMDDKIKAGYKIIAGSTIIKSKLWDISSPEGELLNDVDHAITVAITGKHDYMIYAKTLDAFKSVVNTKLESENYKIVVGSLKIGVIKHSGFNIKADRVYLTYYGCALYKD